MGITTSWTYSIRSLFISITILYYISIEYIEYRFECLYLAVSAVCVQYKCTVQTLFSAVGTGFLSPLVTSKLQYRIVHFFTVLPERIPRIL